ncbi:hypothetical protein ADUPG1_006872 [Aduncisulcus paluster]|uniref:Uncharacterized protein n=1 Tax=Aduncisulcus paluster TaxID=2918883 RepID=A0ABQ5KJW0_9EUKA|nr:hypothetical protein ADUPG1_006872 [Aduncisulcus paluster]
MSDTEMKEYQGQSFVGEMESDFGSPGEGDMPISEMSSLSHDIGHIDQISYHSSRDRSSKRQCTMTHSEKLERVIQCFRETRMSREDKRKFAKTLQLTFIPTLSAREVCKDFSCPINHRKEDRLTIYGKKMECIVFSLKSILEFICASPIISPKILTHPQEKSCSSWISQYQGRDDRMNLGLCVYVDDVPLTQMAYNPLCVCTVTIINFPPEFRSTLSSRFILFLVPGGKVSDLKTFIINEIQTQLRECEDLKVFFNPAQKYIDIHTFLFVFTCDSPFRHDIYDIPKPTGTCRLKCSRCTVFRDDIHVMDSCFPLRRCICPFDIKFIPADFLHMEGRTFLRVFLPPFVSLLERKEGIEERLSEYKCGVHLNICHSTTFTAHQFFQFVYVLPGLCIDYDLPLDYVRAAKSRAQYQKMARVSYFNGEKTKEIVEEMKTCRSLMKRIDVSTTALCINFFPHHLEEMVDTFGSIFNCDTDIEERLNGYIIEQSRPSDIRDYKALALRAQSKLCFSPRALTVMITPRDEGWNPSHGTWCSVKSEEGFYYVKLFAMKKLPDEQKERIKNVLVTEKEHFPGSSFLIVQYFKKRSICRMSGDIILTEWGSHEDNFGVEPKESMYKEIRVCGKRLLCYHPYNDEYFT